MTLDPAAHRAGVDAWHRRRLERLVAPDGWLSLVGLHWLQEGENTVGSAEDATVRLPAAAPAFVGVIEVRGGACRLRAAREVGLQMGDAPVEDADLASDDAGNPTVLRLGTLTIHVIRRQDRMAARVRDEESPARKSFAGIERFPVDLSFCADALLVPDPARSTLRMPTIVSIPEDYPHAGSLRFVLDMPGGPDLAVAAVREPFTDDLFVVFGDGTNGKETYGGGRFLRVPLPDAGGRTVIDFNRAYNPPCVFTPHATCPLPLPENRLPVPVTAGEMLYVPG